MRTHPASFTTLGDVARRRVDRLDLIRRVVAYRETCAPGAERNLMADVLDALSADGGRLS